MRYVQVRVDEQTRGRVVERLRDRDIEYFLAAGAGDQSELALVLFAIPTDAVEYVLSDLRDAGVGEESFTVVTSAEFAITRTTDELQNRYAKTPNRLAPDELRSKAKDLRPNTRTFSWMMFLSAVVATAGLLLSSPAVVVGSMVIAPIVSPALTASLGAIRDDREMLVDSIRMQAIGLALAIASAFAFAFTVKTLGLVPETLAITDLELIRSRMAPGFLSLSVALAAGAAAAYGLATKGSASIVGVMIAAALIPTAAVSGIGVAWGIPVLAVGALVLLLLNIIAINIAAFAMLWYLNYRPDEVDEGLFEFDTVKRIGLVVLTVLVLAAVLGTGTASYQQMTFERGVNQAVTDVLDQDPYTDLEILELNIEHAQLPFRDGPVSVTVTLSRTTDQSYLGLPDEFAAEIADRTNRNVVVRVQYVDYDQSQAGN